jgi:hypothetical protein
MITYKCGRKANSYHFKRAKDGKMLESDVKIEDIPHMVPGKYNIYFDGICIKPKYRNPIVLKKLLSAMFATYEELAENGIFIDEICTWAYTDSGSALCRSMGLAYIKEHEDTGKVYCGTMYDLLQHPLCKQFPRLKNLYKSV